MSDTDLSDLPVWLQPATLKQWATQAITSDALHYSLMLHEDWQLVNTIKAATSATAAEMHYRGDSLSEWCIIHYLAAANPDDDLKAWVESPIALTGFPILAMQTKLENPARVLEMSYYGDFDEYLQQVGCEEMHAYDGIIQMPAEVGGLAHFYILALRQGKQAWKIELSFTSACPPGTDEELLNRNDHVRAGASLGFLKLG